MNLTTLDDLISFNKIYKANRDEINNMITEPARQILMDLERLKSGGSTTEGGGDNFNNMLMNFCSAYNVAVGSWTNKFDIENWDISKVDVPDGLYKELFEVPGAVMLEGGVELPFERLQKQFPARPQKEPTEAFKIDFGCITVFEDFETVHFNNHYYDIRCAKQPREILRYLCSVGAVSERTGKNKHDILDAMKEHIPEICANDWKPSDAFKHEHRSLYDAIGQNNGHYWIKP